MPRRVLRQCLRFALYLPTASAFLRALESFLRRNRPLPRWRRSPRRTTGGQHQGCDSAGYHGQSYLMVLPVRRRIHCGIGRFCFCALASFCFVRKDLWLYDEGDVN